MSLLEDVKKNLIIDDDSEDSFISTIIETAVSYAEGYQHLDEGFYLTNTMSPSTRGAIIIFASHLYESRDGSTGGFFNDSVQASEQTIKTVNMLLRLDRDWKV